MRNTLFRIQYQSFLFVVAALLFCQCGTEKSGTEKEKTSAPVFKKVYSDHSGVTFKNTIRERFEIFFDFFAYVYNGGGVAIGDINNDGLSDIYFTGNEVPNRLYLNQGELKFKDITAQAGVDGGKGWDNGVTMVDINADGWLDIYVCRGGWQDTDEQRKNLLYVNQGNLTFKEQATEYGLDEMGYSNHASFFDMDNDNDLDVYIINRPDSFYLPLSQMAARKKNPPEKNRDKLYINENGKFREIGLQAGITNNYGYALSVVTADLNQDGYIDIYVSNDYSEADYMYINQGDGTFKEQMKQAMNHISLYSMGADVADINNDGLEDIMVMEMRPEDYVRSKVSMPSMNVEGFYEIVNYGMHKQYMHNMLHLNQGNLFFSEISQLAGIAKTDWSWACLASDFDNDGYRDLFVSNGFRRDVFDGDVKQRLAQFVNKNKGRFNSPEELFGKGFEGIINSYKPVKVRNYLFKNTGHLKFDNVSEAWGFDETSFSNGAAVGDLDNDGDLDLVVNNLEDEAFIYENTSEDNNYLKIKLQGPDKNPAGLGAKLWVYYDNQLQYFENKTVRGYLSSNEPVLHFGLGDVEEVDSIRVQWNDGKENVVKSVKSGQTIEITHSQGVVKGRKGQVSGTPKLFTEATGELFDVPFRHRENKFNEYKEQVLLPHMFSRSGPFLSVGDVNRDGHEDLFVGGAAGQAGSLYLQRDNKLVKKVTAAFEKDKAYEDMGSALFDADGDGDLDLYVVSGGSEFPQGHKLYQDRLYLNDGKGNFTKGILPATVSSGSCIVPHDVDGDGDLDLFRGGQVVAGGYPRAPRSYLFINDKGKFIDKTIDIAPELAEAGMVNAAVWTDLNGDGTKELVVAGEWMPVSIFEYTQQALKNVSARYGLINTEGWWNTVVAEDLDGDGDQDLVMGNLGENYKFKASPEKPFQVYAKDFDVNGTNDIFLAGYYQNRVVPIRGRECTSQQMPVIAQKFPSYQAFAEADLPQIVGEGIDSALHYKAYVFSSVILLNENGKLVQKKLPLEAQFSATNSLMVNDFDGDGIKDILCAGNKFDVEVETTPADASPGWFLKDEGKLSYHAAKPVESGFFVPYNAKDMKMIKMGDNAVILVTENDGTVRAFRSGLASKRDSMLAASR